MYFLNYVLNLNMVYTLNITISNFIANILPNYRIPILEATFKESWLAVSLIYAFLFPSGLIIVLTLLTFTDNKFSKTFLIWALLACKATMNVNVFSFFLWTFLSEVTGYKINL